ncbi:hypothetical protein Tco_0008236 [Tanacetum coccineum]
MKAVKEKEQLKKTVDSWKDSSKNLRKLVDSGMTSNSKVGLGYEIKSNNEVLSYEEEMNQSVFKCTGEDYINIPFTVDFKGLNSFKGANVNTGRVNVDFVRHHVNSVRTNVNTGRSKQPDHPLKNMEDRGIFDSGCSGHMTGNKDHLNDFEEYKGGSVTFGGSKGYITGKGRIRHKVLFTETECLVVSPDFKMPDKNQILLKVPRQNNMYSFDMWRQLGLQRLCFVYLQMPHLF